MSFSCRNHWILLIPTRIAQIPSNLLQYNVHGKRSCVRMITFSCITKIWLLFLSAKLTCNTRYYFRNISTCYVCYVCQHNNLTFYVCHLEKLNVIFRVLLTTIILENPCFVKNVTLTYLTSYFNYPPTYTLIIGYVIIVSYLKLKKHINIKYSVN